MEIMRIGLPRIRPLPCLRSRPGPRRRSWRRGSVDIKRVCDAGLSTTKNGQQLADYLRFLAYTGAREQEALRIRWTVDRRGVCAETGHDRRRRRHEKS